MADTLDEKTLCQSAREEILTSASGSRFCDSVQAAHSKQMKRMQCKYLGDQASRAVVVTLGPGWVPGTEWIHSTARVLITLTRLDPTQYLAARGSYVQRYFITTLLLPAAL